MPTALSTALLDDRPNPFNPVNEINFRLARDGHAGIGIYDLRECLVRRLVEDDLAVFEAGSVRAARTRT